MKTAHDPDTNLETNPAASLEAGDATLLAQLAQPSAAALRRVVDEHAGALHRIGYRMTSDAHEAEDIAQEAILKLWDNAARLNEKSIAPAAPDFRIAAWLKRVAINLAIDRLRKASGSSHGGAILAPKSDGLGAAHGAKTAPSNLKQAAISKAVMLSERLKPRQFFPKQTAR